jgi:hypothetical protein
MEDERHEYASCNAIAKAINGLGPEGNCGALNDPYDELQGRFEKVFRHNSASWWWPEPPRARDYRVVALCLMAAMVETGDA